VKCVTKCIFIYEERVVYISVVKVSVTSAET